MHSHPVVIPVDGQDKRQPSTGLHVGSPAPTPDVLINETQDHRCLPLDDYDELLHRAI